MKKYSIYVWMFAFSAAVLISDSAFAQQSSGIVKAFERLNGIFATFPNLVATIAQLVGFVLVFKSTFSLRAMGNREDSNSNEGKKALFFFISGMMAIGLPAVVGLGATTMFGSTSAVMSEGQMIKYK